MLQIDFIVTIIRMSLDEPCELNTEQKTELMSSPTTPHPSPSFTRQPYQPNLLIKLLVRLHCQISTSLRFPSVFTSLLSIVPDGFEYWRWIGKSCTCSGLSNTVSDLRQLKQLLESFSWSDFAHEIRFTFVLFCFVFARLEGKGKAAKAWGVWI